MKDETSPQILQTLKVNKQERVPWWSSGYDSALSLPMAQVQSLVGNWDPIAMQRSKTSKQTKKIISKCEQLYDNKFEIQIFLKTALGAVWRISMGVKTISKEIWVKRLVQKSMLTAREPELQALMLRMAKRPIGNVVDSWGGVVERDEFPLLSA